MSSEFKRGSSGKLEKSDSNKSSFQKSFFKLVLNLENVLLYNLNYKTFLVYALQKEITL